MDGQRDEDGPWGEEVPESQREALIAYLVKNFGPDNDRFQPIVTRPVGR
jgi:hypothetical protein